MSANYSNGAVNGGYNNGTSNGTSHQSNGAGPRMPVVFVAHGGGPGFLIGDEFLKRTMGEGMARDLGRNSAIAKYLAAFPSTLPATPSAILLISAHYEVGGKGVAVYAHQRPEMLYDYSGFPEQAYTVKYNAPGSPELAQDVQRLLAAGGIECALEHKRGYDHGCFCPLLVMYPEGAIPVVQLSMNRSLDPKFHYAIGKALAPLRDQGVLIIGSGFSVHDLSFGVQPGQSKQWDDWLNAACVKSGPEREQLLCNWRKAPYARDVHPREEHLIPLHIVAGAAENEPGVNTLQASVMGWAVSNFVFGA